MHACRAHSVWFMWLVLLAVTLRAFIPLGYMPDKSAAGRIQMVVCTGSGLQTLSVPADFDPSHPPVPSTHVPSPDGRDAHDRFCAIGVSASWFAVPVLLVLLFVVMQQIAAQSYPRRVKTGALSRRVSSCLARGPPRLLNV